MDKHIEELLVGYALGELTDDEKREVEAYLARHPEAEAELNELVQAFDALAHAASPMQPSAVAETALMARVAADARQQTGVSEPEAVRERNGRLESSDASTTFGEWLRGLFASPALSGAGLALALLLFIWAFVLLGRNNALQAENRTLSAQRQQLADDVAALTAENETLAADNEALASENSVLENRVATLAEENDQLQLQVSNLAQREKELEADVDTLAERNEQLVAQLDALELESERARQVMTILTSPRVETVTIPGNPETQPQAEGQLIVDAESNTAILVVTGMEPLPADRVYQVLLIQGSEHETAETFVVDTQGESVLIVSSENPLGVFDAVGVSIEPEGGSEQRTGEIVLLGSLIN